MLKSQFLAFFFLSWTPGISQTLEKLSVTFDTLIIHLADPAIFAHNETYYLYGTVENNAENGFLVYVSDDLQKWKLSEKNEGYALRKGDAFGTSGFWAPQVFFHRSKFYISYTANENIAIAESNSPLGPFRQTARLSLQAPVKQIDPFVFIDEDGKKYLYHVRLVKGNRIFVAELTNDFSSIKPETLRECITATEGWENTVNADWPVTEGPSVLKHRGVYYLFYAANDFRNPDYAVGYATSNNPFGPWKKHPGNPVLNKESVRNNGPGHGDFFTVKDQLYYVFHTHNNKLTVGPRKTALLKAVFVNKIKTGIGNLVMDPDTFYFLHR